MQATSTPEPELLEFEPHTPETLVTSQRLFDTLEKRGLQHTSKQTLEVMMDPFHDSPLPLPGFPGPGARWALSSLTQGAVDITASQLTLAPDETWSYLSWTSPLDTTQLQTNPGRYFTGNTVITVPNTTPYAIAGIAFLNVVCVTDKALAANGGRFYPTADFTTTYAPGEISFASWSPTTEQTVIPPVGPGRDSDITSGVHKFYGGGIEYTPNMTSLTNSGVLTIGRMPNYHEEFAGLIFEKDGVGPPSELGYSGNLPTTVIPLPPNSVDDNTRPVQSRTWAAKHGLYSVFTLSDVQDVPYVQPKPMLTVATSNPAEALRTAEPTNDNAIVTVGVQAPLGVLIANGMPLANSCHNLDMHVCVATGLHAGAKMRAVVRLLGNRVPDMSFGAADRVLIPYATLTPATDEFFNHVYTELCKGIPPGVPLGMNPTGEWFANIARGAAEVAGAMFPAARPVTNLLGTGIEALQAHTRRKKANKNEINREVDREIRKLVEPRPKKGTRRPKNPPNNRQPPRRTRRG